MRASSAATEASGRSGPAASSSSAGGLLGREAQVGGAQFGQLPVGAQPGQRQRRVGAAGQHQVQSRRQVLEQERQRRVHRLGVDQVVVVEDQQHLVIGELGPAR